MLVIQLDLLFGWVHVSASTLRLGNIIMAQQDCPLNDVMFWSGLTIGSDATDGCMLIHRRQLPHLDRHC